MIIEVGEAVGMGSKGCSSSARVMSITSAIEAAGGSNTGLFVVGATSIPRNWGVVLVGSTAVG